MGFYYIFTHHITTVLPKKNNSEKPPGSRWRNTPLPWMSWFHMAPYYKSPPFGMANNSPSTFTKKRISGRVVMAGIIWISHLGGMKQCNYIWWSWWISPMIVHCCKIMTLGGYLRQFRYVSAKKCLTGSLPELLDPGGTALRQAALATHRSLLGEPRISGVFFKIMSSSKKSTPSPKALWRWFSFS